jgi:hypothetical protein
MSSTIALPVGHLSPVRLFGRRRRNDSCESTPTSTESFGLQFLRKVANWKVVDHSRIGFVDQIVITPSAVLAISTRYHDVAEGEAHVRRAWQDIKTTLGAAKLMALTLGEGAPTVQPVLMVWGPGAPELEDGHLLVKGVRIVDYRRPELWTHLFDAPVIDDVQRHRLSRELSHLADEPEYAEAQ